MLKLQTFSNQVSAPIARLLTASFPKIPRARHEAPWFVHIQARDSYCHLFFSLHWLIVSKMGTSLLVVWNIECPMHVLVCDRHQLLFYFGCEILPNVELKNMISIYTKYLSWIKKNNPNSSNFEENNFKSPNFMISSSR